MTSAKPQTSVAQQLGQATPPLLPPVLPRWRRVLQLLGSRLLAAWVVVALLATLVFFALQIGGSPLQAALGGPGSQAGAEAAAAVRAQYGLDAPLWQQYLGQLWRALTLQFGDSLARKQPVSDLLAASLPATFGSAVAALILAWLLVFAGAFLTAVCADGWLGRAVRSLFHGVSSVAALTPQFVSGAIVVALSAGLFGAVGKDAARQLTFVLQVFVLALPVAGYLALVLAGSVAKVRERSFVLAARARGAGRVYVFLRHILRHALPSALALSGWAFGSLLSGAVVVEAIFARPGLGRLLLEAATVRDVPVVVAAVTVIAFAYVFVMTVVDLLERGLHLAD